MKLLIISNMAHYVKGSEIVGWGSAIEEINHLASLFDSVNHIGCLHKGNPPVTSIPYNSEKIKFIPLPPTGGNGIKDKIEILKLSPFYISTIIDEIKKVDAVHIRCPANIPLLSLLNLLVSKKPKYRWVKYAGNWCPKGNEALSYKLQRWLLRHNLHKGTVTVNGVWPNQQSHIFTFNNPSFTKEQINESLLIGKNKSLQEPVQLLFVGRIEEAKGVGRIIKIAQCLKNRGISFKINLVGDGPRRNIFENIVMKMDLANYVDFTGLKSKDEVEEFYKMAHIIILPSTASEGWPKVLSEAMAYGVVPIASTVSSIPQIINKYDAGLAIPAEEIEAYADAIIKFIENERIWKQASLNGIRAADDFTYEHYLSAVRNMFNKAWSVDLNKD